LIRSQVRQGAEVAQHSIRSDGACIKHQVKFASGGEFLATFDKSGELTELSGQHLSITNNAGALLVGPFRHQENPSV
jgi:hypothetical protein